jgi:hypothetical protein
MIADILISQTDAVDPLREHLANIVIAVATVAAVDEALGE